MNPRHLHIAGLVFVFFHASITAAAISAVTHAAQPTIPVDAICVLTGGTNVGESDAVPILLSDIEFEAFLILTGENGPDGISKTLTAKDWRHAKERAVIIRLLADQARRLHETASGEDKKALLTAIVNNMGDAAAMNSFLARMGMPRDAMDRWIENAALALSQLRFMKDQTAMSGDREGRRGFVGSREPADDNEGSVSRKLRRIFGRKIGNDELKKRLIEAVHENHIRVLR